MKEPIEISKPVKEEKKVAEIPIITSKTEEVTRIEERPKFEAKTFKERRKEIPFYDD
jgi:hypothetical protein